MYAYHKTICTEETSVRIGAPFRFVKKYQFKF
nr:MAG TPA: hypothetical protein [Caudoviricetes sp.]